MQATEFLAQNNFLRETPPLRKQTGNLNKSALTRSHEATSYYLRVMRILAERFHVIGIPYHMKKALNAQIFDYSRYPFTYLF